MHAYLYDTFRLSKYDQLCSGLSIAIGTRICVKYMSTNCRRRSCGANGARTRRGVKTAGLTLRPRRASRASRTRRVQLPLRIAQYVAAGWIAAWTRDYGNRCLDKRTDHLLTFHDSSLRSSTRSPLERRWISSDSRVLL